MCHLLGRAVCACVHVCVCAAGALGFSIKRGGLLYGTVGEDKVVRVS